MNISQIIENRRYIQCENIFEHKKLMKYFDDRRYYHEDLLLRNEGDAFQRKFYNFDKSLCFKFIHSTVYSYLIENVDKDMIIKLKNIDDFKNKVLHSNELLSISTSPNEVKGFMDDLYLSSQENKEKSLLEIIENLINQVNYLESYIIAQDSKQQEMIKEQERERIKNLNIKAKQEEQFYTDVYYMSDDELQDYVNRNIAGDDWNRHNEFWNMRRKACEYMNDYNNIAIINKITKNRE